MPPRPSTSSPGSRSRPPTRPGRFNISLPAGGKLLSAVAGTGWSTGPWFFAWDANNSPPGGNYVNFIAYAFNGTPAINGVVPVAYQITYTF